MYIHVGISVYGHVILCMYVQVCTCTYILVCTYLYVCMCLHIDYACRPIYVCTFVYCLLVYVRKYVYTHMRYTVIIISYRFMQSYYVYDIFSLLFVLYDKWDYGASFQCVYPT